MDTYAKTAGAVPFEILRRQDWFAPLSNRGLGPFITLLQQSTSASPTLLVMGKAQVQGPFLIRLHILVAHVRVLLSSRAMAPDTRAWTCWCLALKNTAGLIALMMPEPGTRSGLQAQASVKPLPE